MNCATRWAGYCSVLGSVLALAGCKGSDGAGGQCVHPCDLAQSLWVDIVGDELAAALSVSDACGGGGTCPASLGCRSFSFYLENPPPSSGPEITCHVTAVSTHGDVAERDAVASFTDGACCFGYEFSTRWIEIRFVRPDAGTEADGATPNDARD